MKKLIILTAVITFSIVGSLYAENKTIQFRLVLNQDEAKNMPHDIFEYKGDETRLPREIIVSKTSFLSNHDIKEVFIVRAKNRYKQYPEEYKTITDKGVETLKISHEERKGWYTEPEIEIRFTQEGAKKLEEFSRNNKKRRCAVVFDGKILMAPIMMVPLTKGQIDIASPYIPNDKAAEDVVKQLGFKPKYIYE